MATAGSYYALGRFSNSGSLAILAAIRWAS